MKGLKKLALATAVAAAPFAQAELTAMDDALLADMTGQAGITIDVDLDMTIDAIKYVDQDGNADGSGVQGAITMKSLTIDNDGGAATIRGITIDADGTDGLVIGLTQIGDELGNGIDINVAGVMINNGNANLNNYNAMNAANAALLGGGSYTYTEYSNGTAQTAIVGAYSSAATSYGTANTTAFTNTVGSMTGTYASPNELFEAAASGDATAAADLAVMQGDAAYDASGEATYGVALNDVSVLQTAAAEFQSAGAGNIGGFRIDNFRNYIQDDLVNKYNGVFDMALMDDSGAIVGDAALGGSGGRFVRGEIVINGTGNLAQGTAGLEISGQFGGAIDKAAWVDDGGEFGIADLGFFHGVDSNSDGISDTIEGMHFSVNIDVVDRVSSISGSNVAQLAISDMSLTGTIMMGDIYLASDAAGTGQTSLGSVLIKDIDMTGTTVYIYGH